MDYKKLTLIFGTLLFSLSCFAEFNDPTRPNSYSVKAEATAPQSKRLKLSSIWISGDAKRATINGVTAKQGDLILSSIKILNIENNAVFILQNGKKRKLTLFTHSFKTW